MNVKYVQQGKRLVDNNDIHNNKNNSNNISNNFNNNNNENNNKMIRAIRSHSETLKVENVEYRFQTLHFPFPEGNSAKT